MTGQMIPPALERRILFPLDAYTGLQAVTIDNPGWLRILYWCVVTSNPGGGELVQLLLAAGLPHAGSDFIAPGTAPSDLGGVPGVMSLAAGPGVGSGWLAFGANKVSGFKDTMLAQQLSFSFSPLGGGSWTMEAGVDGWW